jgi:hypothetical protein
MRMFRWNKLPPLELSTIVGTKVVVCGPVDTHLADGSVPTKHTNCHVFLPSVMHAWPPPFHLYTFATCVRLSLQRRRVSSRRFEMGPVS